MISVPEVLDGGRIPKASDIEAFMLAGRSIFTIVSVATGTRFTYAVQRPVRRNRVSDPKRPWFVSVQGEHDAFEFLGSLMLDGDYRHGRKSALAAESMSSRAFRWFWERLRSGQDPFPVAEFWHAGRCGMCARRLTVPASIEIGIGPECLQHLTRCVEHADCRAEPMLGAACRDAKREAAKKAKEEVRA